MESITKNTQTKIRDELIDLVLADLIGPKGGPEEEIDETRLTSRYILGRLAPHKLPAKAPEEQDDLGVREDPGPEDGEEEDTPAPIRSMFPSAMGLSFAISRHVKEFQVKAHWGQYKKEVSETLTTEKGNYKKVWKRQEIHGKIITLRLEEGKIDPLAASDVEPEIKIQGTISRVKNSDWFITLFLVNTRISENKLNDEDWIFQSQLEVFDEHNEAIFVRRSLRSELKENMSMEEQILELNYFHKREFAAGHNVSVEADVSKDDSEMAYRIRTSWVPVFEQQYSELTSPENEPTLQGIILDMKRLATEKKSIVIESLKTLPAAYHKWLKTQAIGIENKKLNRLHEAATTTLALCEEAKNRINEGIKVLEENEQAYQAFEFANLAMYHQRIRSLYSEARRTGRKGSPDDFKKEENHRWHLFQLAFIIMTLPSLADLSHPDRSDNIEAIADLLWFQTGGGKTEAYLGLTAFAIAIRRLQGIIYNRDGHHGVTVIMRYTLRLLTLQQFQRATALLCSMEHIRRSMLADGEPRFGEIPFRIGLWVGNRSTPGTTNSCKEAILQLKSPTPNFSNYIQGSPHQLTHCPWCGSKIDPKRDIIVETNSEGKGRTFIYCSDPMGKCEFSRVKADKEGLPVLLVDEEIYRNPPSLLIATVDKFAQMPWQGQIQALFGQIDKYCPRHGFTTPELSCPDSHPKKGDYPAVKVKDHIDLRPPDLIIQDELHLISGPLGSLVGLYETAVDGLCSWQDDHGNIIRPKVIASTATINMATEQIKRIFLRKGKIFPPTGISVENNFFVRFKDPTLDHPGRKYIGIISSGERLKVLMIRLYQSFLAAAKLLHNRYGSPADPYMTLVGYFNSLRELGGMRRLVEDDISTHMYQMEKRGLANRRFPIIEELTSRKTSTDIPIILEQLEQPHKVDKVATTEPEKQDKSELSASETKKKKEYLKRPIDVLLATNMISVGVDVKRLGLMVVANQPKTTSEYIQATSRIGRSFPGVVCTAYNWARPRDLSHYETFNYYHSTFYKHVEANTVTPFASGSIERGLPGIIVSLIRLMSYQFNSNRSAGTFDKNNEISHKAKELIIKRAATLGIDVTDTLQNAIDDNINIWLKAIEKETALGYKEEKGDIVKLLEQFGEKKKPRQLYCMNSLRNVEQSTNLTIIDEFSEPEE